MLFELWLLLLLFMFTKCQCWLSSRIYSMGPKKCNGGYSGSSIVLGAIIWRRQGCRRNGQGHWLDPVVGAEHGIYVQRSNAAPVRLLVHKASGGWQLIPCMRKEIINIFFRILLW